MNADEYFQGIAESQIPDPFQDALDSLRFKLSYDLYELVTDEEISRLQEMVTFSREVKSDEPIF